MLATLRVTLHSAVTKEWGFILTHCLHSTLNHMSIKNV